ncbi:MAG: thiamine pyrophosphate-dependent enzyme [Candidatus Pacearchaeota archaeon]
MESNLRSKEKITWCPGCTNFFILNAFEKALNELIKQGMKKEEFVYVSGIGCHGKIHDYLNISSFNALHGRVLPVIFGIKIANPKLKVIGFAGDGDAYNEGIEHLIHMAKYNIDCTYVIHDNQIFALTVGQPTATTQKGLKSKSFKKVVQDTPLNPIKLMLSLDTSFVARAYALEHEHLKDILKKAIMHKGFSFVEVLQPCIVFNDTREFIGNRIYKLEEENHDVNDFNQAWKKAEEWNYCYDDSRIPIGIFYIKQKETFEEKYLK